jgi:Na+/glutamate symporter
VSFAAGATVPILPFLFISGARAIAVAAVVVGAALFATGAVVGVLSGGPLARRGLRQLGSAPSPPWSPTGSAASSIPSPADGRVYRTLNGHTEGGKAVRR